PVPAPPWPAAIPTPSAPPSLPVRPNASNSTYCSDVHASSPPYTNICADFCLAISFTPSLWAFSNCQPNALGVGVLQRRCRRVVISPRLDSKVIPAHLGAVLRPEQGQGRGQLSSISGEYVGEVRHRD